MSNLIILRGVSGTGKSTFAKELNSETGAVISSDVIRLMLLGSAKHQHANDLVFETLFDIVRHRMAERCNVIIDATNIRLRESRRYFEEAMKWGYRITVVNFESPSIEELEQRIQQRVSSGGLHVPVEAIKRQAERMKNCEPEFKKYVEDVGGIWTTPENFKSLGINRHTMLDECSFVDQYAIGDVHACVETLQRLQEKCIAESEARGKIAQFILLGDTIDRGPDGFKALLNPYNSYVLGNHEWLFLRERNEYHKCRSKSRAKTHELFEKLEPAQQEQVLNTIKKMPSYLVYENDGITFVLSHAPCIVSSSIHMAKVDVSSFRAYTMNDRSVEPWMSECYTPDRSELVNVHGHQSWQYEDVKECIARQKDSAVKLINVDSGAVYGGYMTALRLDHELHVVQVQSDYDVESVDIAKTAL